MIKIIIKIFLSFNYKILLFFKIVKPKIIVRVNGGICSQMHQYLLGRVFYEKGYNVTYNLLWYKKHGKDSDGFFNRNFDLLKAFPYLNFRTSNLIESIIYAYIFSDKTNYYDHTEEDLFLYDLKPPIYLCGHYHTPMEVYIKLFSKYFHLNPQVLDSYSQSFFKEIQNHKNTVGVHVRRGDLKIFKKAYGYPSDILYFQNAVSFFHKIIKTPVFYFFSDEPEWVEEELIEKLPTNNIEYKIVKNNGSDKGYMDLFLLAYCEHQITSKGSLGKYGALLCNSEEKIVVFCNDPIEFFWKKLFKKSIYL